MKTAIKETFVLMAKLGIICIIVAGVLGYINSLTAPVIKINEQKNFESSMTQVMEKADSFEELKLSYIPEETGVELDSVYSAKSGTENIGFVATAVCHEGYGGDITVMVGINKDFTINRIKIMSMSETAGLGAKAGEEKFSSQYTGLSHNIGVEKNNGGSAENNTISAISGATVTSKAVTKAVNCAVDAAMIGGGINE